MGTVFLLRVIAETRRDAHVRATAHGITYAQCNTFACLQSYSSKIPFAAIHMELMATADFMDAQEAHRVGLLNRVVPHDELRDATLAMAHQIAANPPIGVRLSKMLMWRGLYLDYDTAMEWSASAAPLTEMSRDHHESVQAFLEKREATFKGI